MIASNQSLLSYDVNIAMEIPDLLKVKILI